MGALCGGGGPSGGWKQRWLRCTHAYNLSALRALPSAGVLDAREYPGLDEEGLSATYNTHLAVCAFVSAGVLDPSEYPGFDEEEGGVLAAVETEVSWCWWGVA